MLRVAGAHPPGVRSENPCGHGRLRHSASHEHKQGEEAGVSAWARCQSAGAGTQCPGRELAGGRASASENSLTQQLGKWVCSPAPQINRSGSLRSAAGSAWGGRARSSGTSTRSSTRTPHPCMKPSPDPPGQCTAGRLNPPGTRIFSSPQPPVQRTTELLATGSVVPPSPTHSGTPLEVSEWLVTVSCRESSLL